ncbi:uncharacterized protein LOC107362061 [Tetranychus urticae]|uniref:uncharacterized protein LOC107362061 n=1 Tax=Tetranychus urticae TaxID=32264 RepID=UPI00077BEFE6|nr:uncharacterized protein LOC107362061 [Tetranychus urticae]
MNIDNLPDDCFLYIFKHFYRFETLMNCASVCKRWKYLVLERLKNVKYLSDSWQGGGYPARYTIFLEADVRLELLEWFPKLKILDIERDFDKDFISNVKVKGLQLAYNYYIDLEDVTCHNPSLEMLSISHFCSFFANEIQGPTLKQLYVECLVSDFASYAKYFPNLKRLHIQKYGSFMTDAFADRRYTGPVLEKLEILEIIFYLDQHGMLDNYHGFSLADHCPALKSAFHYIQTDEEFFVNSGIKNHFLQDLVLQFNEPQGWPVLRRILSKYPNLKHLAIRGNPGISDENIPELLELLPRIILIDIRYSPKVTEKSTEYIDWYCRRHNRSISFYYQKRPLITKKWPHLSTKRVRIGRGFDFMKYCFLRNYNELPFLLDPDE